MSSPARGARLDPQKEAAMREAVSHLSAAEAAVLLDKLGASLQRRRYQLVGYLVAAIAGFLGFVIAMIVYASREPGTFVGWVFAIPFAGIGLSLFIFGRLAERAGQRGLTSTTGPLPARAARAASTASSASPSSSSSSASSATSKDTP